MNFQQLLIVVISITIAAISSPTFGQQDPSGSAAEARAMLARAINAVRADRTKALDMFNRGEGGFRDRDLYVICINASDDKFVAIGNPNAKGLLGMDANTFEDIDGDPMSIAAAGQKPDGDITVSDYEFPKPGTDKTPVPKETYFTKIGNLICGVGYYYLNNE
jgi:hypothetical protein